MEFEILYYETRDGKQPVEEFLVEIERQDPKEFRQIAASIGKLERQANHGTPLTKALGEGLYELRVLGKLNTRLFWFFRREQRIIIVHGIRNKAQKIRPQDLQVARGRMHDWIERND